MTQPFNTRILPFSDAVIAEAAQLIAAGQPVAVPTETVYGLAADATNAAAVARIYEAKERPSFNPLIVHVSSLEEADRLAELDGPLRRLAEAHWPGPLTIVAPRKPGSPIAAIVTAGLPTIAIRVPAHRAMQALLKACGTPLAAPSANASGTISSTRAEHVLRSLGGRIPLVIDDGPSAGGLESTIVGESGGALRMLRPGPIQIPAIEVPQAARIEAPGQMASHYAPSKPLRIDVRAPADDEYMIGFGTVPGDSTLSESGNLVEAAARFFDLLHAADVSAKPKIAVAPIPAAGLGTAINDRLGRAAAPR